MAVTAHSEKIDPKWIMSDRLLTRPEVETRCGITRSTIYRMMRAGQFPEPVKVGPSAVRWPESEIEEWLNTRPRATGEGAGAV